ncbi:MAG: hypothetical protein ACL7BU_10300 [Candidatus Phlomobacter fragariae]
MSLYSTKSIKKCLLIITTREFEESSIPDNRIIKRWIEVGKLKGKIVDGFVWVVSPER